LEIDVLDRVDDEVTVCVGETVNFELVRTYSESVKSYRLSEERWRLVEAIGGR